jgi:hypothetical protein
MNSRFVRPFIKPTKQIVNIHLGRKTSLFSDLRVSFFIGIAKMLTEL